MPRWAAPQAPHGPGSKAAADRDDDPTAKTDKSFSTFELSHFLQATLDLEEGTIFSKVVPQSRHLYSNSGMGISCWQYKLSHGWFAIGATGRMSVQNGCTGGAFFLAFFGESPLKSLDTVVVIEYIVARH